MMDEGDKRFVHEDDKRFMNLSCRQVEHRIKRRALARGQDRVYDRDINLRRDVEKPPQTIERKYEEELLLKELFKEKK